MHYALLSLVSIMQLVILTSAYWTYACSTDIVEFFLQVYANAFSYFPT